MDKNKSIEEFNQLMQSERDNLEIIDVREPDEFESLRIKDSKLIPMYDVMGKVDEIDWNKKVILVCRTGSRSSFVASSLDEAGKTVMNLVGGIIELNSSGSEFLEK